MAAAALITGASGLIGAYLLARWDVPGIKPVAVRHAEHDLLATGTAAALVASYRPDIVVHLAWSASGTRNYRLSDDNARWTRVSLELADACQAYSVWLIATGTVVDRVHNPSDKYASSKYALRDALNPAITTGSVTWIRPFYVFDPERGRPALVADIVRARRQAKPVLLQSPLSRHDFIHAADVADAMAAIIRNNARGIVEVGTGTTRSVAELADALGASWRPAHDAEDGVVHARDAADVTRLRILGWRPHATEAIFGRR